MVFIVCLPDKPSVPRDLTLTSVTEDSVSLQWSEPEDDGGSVVTGYTVERRESSRTSWTNGMDTTDQHITVTGLTENKTYMLRVAAKNDIGTGPFAEYPEGVTAKCPHGQLYTLYCILSLNF